MAKFLTTKGTSSWIEDIIRNAKDELFLLSPFLNLSEKFFIRLKEADRQNVKIYLIYGKDELKSEAKRQLQQLKNLLLYFCKDLHAKCYFNEETMVITSMNMYEYSENNNWEMGVLVKKKEDRDIFDDVVKEVQSIINSSIKDDLAKHKDGSYQPRTKQKGYCIRCGTAIPYDLEKPFCRKCFSEWLEWENPDYEERHCHTCGKPAPATMLKPQCNSCYNKFHR